MKKNKYLTNRFQFGTNPNPIDPETETNADLWAKTFGKCALCGADIGPVHVLMQPERLFICNTCADKKRKTSLSGYRKHVFGFGAEVNQKANFYFERLLISPSFLRSEMAAFIPEFNPYL